METLIFEEAGCGGVAVGVDRVGDCFAYCGATANGDWFDGGIVRPGGAEEGGELESRVVRI